MNRKDNPLEQAAELHQRTEETQQILFELHTHQIELEMQNEELRRAQQELDATRARYFDLYNLAPVGYCTLSEQGLILQANFTAATLLGLPQDALLKQPITRFILKEDQDIYYLHCKQLIQTSEPQACELRMVKNDGTQAWVYLTTIVMRDVDSALEFRTALSEITERKDAEEKLRLSDHALKTISQGLLITGTLDALSSPLTILNGSGVILYVNQAWKRFADINGLVMANYGVGCNYLEYCEGTKIDQSLEPITVAQGIRSVISGAQEEFSIQYPCHSSTEERWFQMRAVPFNYEGYRHAIISHENITDSKAPEKRLRNILENAPIGMAIVSLDGRFIEVNQALGEILGYEKSDFLNLTCQQINHPDDFNKDKKLMQGLLQGKQNSYRIETRFLRKDGNIVWINLTCSILRDETGVPTHIIKQIQDITEKVKVETCLRNSEHRLNVVLNNMPALIGYWNKNLVNEFGNKAYSEWFGVDPAHIRGMGLREVIGERLYTLNLPYIERVLCGEPQVFERIITDTFGKDHYTLASYIPDTSEDTVKGFFVLVTDITQIKMAELELIKSEQLSQMLLSVSIDGFNFSDLNGRFVDTNSSFCQMLGYTKSEILSMSVGDIEFIENSEQTAKHIKKITADGFDRFETVHRRKDGKLIDVEVSVAYLSDKKQFFAFTRDISQRKQSEKLRIEQLEQQRDTLVREVHHRIKNHLQGMVGLLSLYSYKNPHEKDLIQDIATKITSVAVVYGIQGKNNQDNAYLCEITSEICKSLGNFCNEQSNIKYAVNDHLRALLPSEYAVPIALIINELIMNAIKHNNYSIQKDIEVHLSIKEQSAILIIINSCQEQPSFPSFEQGVGLGVGLSLVRAMLPKKGVDLSLTQRDGNICTQLSLESPVISIVSI